MTELPSAALNRRLLRWSLSEIRHGQLWPVTVALTLIIASIFALTALAQRMEQVIVKQGRDALTADTVFVSANPLPESLLTLTAKQTTLTSQMTRFATMAFSDQGMQLVTVKAVDSAYPLRGEMRLSDGLQVLNHVSANQLWLEPRVKDQLGVNIGDNVTIGDADFVVSGEVLEEPGLSFNPFQQMPSVYIHASDIAKTGAIQPGSRVQFSLFITGDDSVIKAIKQEINLTPSDRWRDQESASRTNEVFERTQQYLSLTVAIVILMAATTLVLTCQHYVSTRMHTIAMLKSLGASRQWLRRWLALQVFLLLAFAVVLGGIIGVGLESLLRLPLKDLLPDPLPSYGLRPLWIALTSSLLIAVPALGIPLGRLLSVSAVAVMQPVQPERRWQRNLLLMMVPVVPLLLVYWQNQLIWIVLMGIVALFVVLALVSVVVTRLFAKLPLNPPMALALSRINRSGTASGLQFGALALSLMLLAIIWLVRTDLLSDWQRTLPENAPNAFALNISESEKTTYLAALDNAHIERSAAYPIMRGRLTHINGQEAKHYAQNGEESSDALRRELNLTWAEQLPDYNPILQGEWQSHNGVSVEQEVASDLGLKLGDTLSFTINSQVVTAKVNTIRQVEWREMKPNFYFIFSPDVVQNLPVSYLISFRVLPEHDALLSQLSRQHPTVSLMDIRTMGAKIQALLTQIVWSVTVLAALGVLAGVLLIFTLLRLSLSQRQQEIRLYRTLGASRRRVVHTIWAEYGVMALVGGFVASLSADLVVAAVMKWGFSLNPSLHMVLWLALPALTFCTLAVVVSSMLKRLLAPVNKAFSD
ncbi:ABC transporter permease [Vibrio metoecus]|uniref:ABC transporter permease n=2 Tax=Vibrio metoecus TaxID=1481663 RepID=UPI0006D80E12|nr:ABC transporter permease [Vibrio metoecus]KQA98825.1 ABC transporter permease [Vibrio metoecus]PAR59156.1 ABC transporter permease [Vibrio metoecus]